jgi:hypothetical protein
VNLDDLEIVAVYNASGRWYDIASVNASENIQIIY